MSYARQLHTATFLSQDSTILIAGGSNGSAAMISTEKYSIVTGCFYLSGNMLRARYYHTADRLLISSESVLFAGGYRVGSLSYADLFNPLTGNVSTIPMSAGRYLQTSILLNTSSLILIGGINVNTVDTCDILNTSSSFSFTANSNKMTTPRHYHTTTRLGNTSDIFLIVGGLNVWTGLSSAELYNGSSNTFIALGTKLSTARFYHAATYIPSVDQVLITGGSSGANPVNTMVVFDVRTMSFLTPTTTMSTNRMYHTSTLLQNGKVLLIGGNNGTASISTCELIDPTNKTYLSTPVASLQIVSILLLDLNGIGVSTLLSSPSSSSSPSFKYVSTSVNEVNVNEVTDNEVQ